MDGSYSYLLARVGGASGKPLFRARADSIDSRWRFSLERWSLEGFWNGTGDQLIGGEDDEEGAAKATPRVRSRTAPRFMESAMSSHWRP
jgi:hypothetical protein